MRITALLAFAAVLAAPLPARAELSVSMHDGLVSVDAKDVTVRQILAEWARVGQTKILNADGLAGGPVTLQLTNVPEQEALDILLRSASGYLAAPRPIPVANASHFDRVIVMPTSTPSRTSSPPPAFAPRNGAFPNDQDDSDLQRNGPPPPAPPLSQQRGFAPVPSAVPEGAPVTAPPVFTAPGQSAPVGSSAPGMVIPVPQPVPGQAVPGQPVPVASPGLPTGPGR